MLSNRLAQVVILSTGLFLTVPMWASANVVEKTPIPHGAKKVSPTNNHFPDVDWHKKHPKKFPDVDWKKNSKKNKTEIIHKHKPHYPDPQIKPQSHPSSTQNYPEPEA